MSGGRRSHAGLKWALRAWGPRRCSTLSSRDRKGSPLQPAVTSAVLVQGDMALSARNQLPGIVENVQIGSIMAHVVVKVGDNMIESVITRTSAEELGLKKGDSVKVVVKSTEVMIQKG
jgi:molybdopterin-binding protein